MPPEKIAVPNRQGKGAQQQRSGSPLLHELGEAGFPPAGQPIDALPPDLKETVPGRCLLRRPDHRHLQPETPKVFTGPLEDLPVQVSAPVLAGGKLRPGGDRLQVGTHGPFQGRCNELFLVREMPVDGTGGEAGGFADHGDSGSLIAVAGGKAHGLFKDPFAGLFALPVFPVRLALRHYPPKCYPVRNLIGFGQYILTQPARARPPRSRPPIPVRTRSPRDRAASGLSAPGRFAAAGRFRPQRRRAWFPPWRRSVRSPDR